MKILSSFTHLMLFQTCRGFFFLQTTKADMLKNVSVHTIKVNGVQNNTGPYGVILCTEKHKSKFYRRKEVKQV